MASVLEAAGTPAVALIAPDGICRAVSRTLPGLHAIALAEQDPRHLRRSALRAAVEVTGSAPTLLLADAERGLTPPAQVQQVLQARTANDDVVLPLAEMTDSVKSWDGTRLHNVDRSRLGTPQSPQVWKRESLERCLAAWEDLAGAAPSGFGNSEADADCPEVRVMLDLGGQVRWVQGSHRGFAVRDRLTHWQAQIAIGQARDTSGY